MFTVGCARKSILLDLILIFFTGGIWLIVMLARFLKSNTK